MFSTNLNWLAFSTNLKCKICLFENIFNLQSQLKNLEQTVLPHIGLQMPFVMTKTTPKSVDLMVEIVVTMKDKDGTTIVLIVNVLHNSYVKNIFMNVWFSEINPARSQ